MSYSYKDTIVKICEEVDFSNDILIKITMRAKEGFRFWESDYDYTFSQTEKIFDVLTFNEFTEMYRSNNNNGYSIRYYKINVSW